MHIVAWTRFKNAPKTAWLQPILRVLSAVGAVVLAVGFGAVGVLAINVFFDPIPGVEPWKQFILGCYGLTALLESGLLLRQMRAEIKMGQLMLVVLPSSYQGTELLLGPLNVFWAILAAGVLPFAFGMALYELFKPRQRPRVDEEFTPFKLQDGA